MTFDLRDVSFTPELLACVPAEVARRYRVLPVSNSDEAITVALSDPSDLDALDSLQRLLRRDIIVYPVEARQLADFIDRLYGSQH